MKENRAKNKTTKNKENKQANKQKKNPQKKTYGQFIDMYDNIILL